MRWRQALRGYTTTGLRAAIHIAQEEIHLARRHFRNVRAVQKKVWTSPLNLNLGCGPNPKAGWVNIDLFSPEAEFQLDLREPWPFLDGSAAIVYSEHVFEHFEVHRETPHVLREALRVLQPGGVFDVGVPDTSWPLRAYFDPTDNYWSHTVQWHPAWCQTRLDHVNYHFRQDGEHQYAWDAETLTRALTQAGFRDASVRPFDPALDTASRALGTLYVRAWKP